MGVSLAGGGKDRNRKMTVEEIIKTPECQSLVNDYRTMCFWNVAEDFLPQNERQLLFALDNLEHYGTMDAYRRAGRIRAWLSQASSQKC